MCGDQSYVVSIIYSNAFIHDYFSLVKMIMARCHHFNRHRESLIKFRVARMASHSQQIFGLAMTM